MKVTIEFRDEESAAKFIENVRRDGCCMTYDEGALGGVNKDERYHYVSIAQED